MEHNSCISINRERCFGCGKCVRRCPTQAMRGGRNRQIEIFPQLCIGCGECMRNCPNQAIDIVQDDWESLQKKNKILLMTDPTFVVQLGDCRRTSSLHNNLRNLGFVTAEDELALAYDVSALAVARRIVVRTAPKPLISSYCPAVLRYIQLHHPGLVNNIVDVDTPFETAATLWREKHGDIPMTLVAPCPAILYMQEHPVGRKKSNFSSAINIRQVMKSLLSSGEKVELLSSERESRARWVRWARCGGESRHVYHCSKINPRTMAVSGIEHVRDVLNEIELGRLACVDFVECRACYEGCIGGTAASESLYTSLSRVEGLNVDWNFTPAESERIEEVYKAETWRMTEPIEARTSQLSLSDDLSVAMAMLKELKKIHASLPGIDCGSCGRPSCKAMAEDIVRGRGSVNECVFSPNDNYSQHNLEEEKQK